MEVQQQMRVKRTHVVLGILSLTMLAPAMAGAQGPVPVPGPPAAPAPAGVVIPAQQLDQMLAPIALYPDPLLAQLLMASTYPLEIVQADRWLRDPANAAIHGDLLQGALAQTGWDPSVQSLVPFPQLLRMMSTNLTWTEQLGEAFLSQQAAVMDSVQRLRRRARVAGRLQSTPQEIVTDQDGYITIVEANPEIVYVPVYDPNLIYGVWPYVGYPPYYFPGFFGDVVIGGFGFGWFGVGIVGPLWGWCGWDWGRHWINLDSGRYSRLNAGRPPFGGGNVWRHDPSHRGGVPFVNPRIRGQTGGPPPLPRDSRGFQGVPPHVVTPPAPHPGPPPGPPSPVFRSFGSGPDMRSNSVRGDFSRHSAPGGGGGPAHQPPGRQHQ
jgi:hypothetical protein